jgi:peptidoglycan/xylan/chitin deacetylase (PgdA/CDA1 family)
MNKKFVKTLIWGIVVLIILIIGYSAYQNVFIEKSSNKDEISYDSNKKDESKKSMKSTQVKAIKNRNFTGNVIDNKNSVPVLMYHSIDYEKGNELRIPKDKFREQMQYLKDNGYTTITVSELYDFLKNNNPVPKKSVVITFDDGYEDNYINAYPVLKEFGFKATIFVVTSTVDKDSNCLTSSELKEMSKNGIDIESHTVNHDKLSQLSYEMQLNTLKESKIFLENVLGKKIYYIAYPYGDWNDNTVKAVESCGYKLAFTTESGWANKDQGIYKLHRVYISNNHDMKEFQRRLTDSSYYEDN